MSEVPPYEAIRDGEFRRVMAAAAAFVDGAND